MINRFRARLLGLLLVFAPVFLWSQQHINIIGPTVMCPGDCVTLTIDSISQPPNNTITLTWTGPGGTTIGSGKIVTVCQPGTYTVVATTANGATQTDTHTITLLPYLPVQIVSDNPAACSPDSASGPDPTDQQYCEKVCPNTTVTYTLQNGPVIGGTSTQYSWNVVGAQSFTVNPPFNSSVTVKWGATGSGSVSVVFSGGSGNPSSACKGEDAICVTIVEQPVAQFLTDPAVTPLQICKGQTVWFDNLSQYADTYEWLFSDDASITTEINPRHTFFNPGIYTVQLIARSACLCADTTALQIEVLDAESPSLDCVGDVCPGTTVTYSASANCNNIQWNVSANGAVLAGGTPGADSITVQWNTGPFGLITLSGFSCTGFACPQPTLVRVPVIDDNAEILGPERVCPDAEEVYTIESYGGTGFTWTLGSGGAITAGQGTHTVAVRWNSFPNPNTTHWLSVKYDNCYLGCGGQDSIPVRIVSSFVINGPVEACENTTKNFTSRLTYNNQSLLCNWTLRAPDGAVGWSSATPTAAPVVPFANGPGLYRLFAVPDNPALSCSDQAEWAINVPVGPPAPSGIDGPGVMCPGQVFTYTAAGLPPGTNIRWTVQNGPGAPLTATGNPLNVNWNPAGPYTLSAVVLSQDGLGCTSAAAQLTVQPAGSLSISGPAQVCVNGTTGYTGPDAPGLALQWSIVPANAGTIVQGQGAKTVQVFWQTPGNHSIQMNICGGTATQPVTVNALPAPVVNHPATLCVGSTATVQTAGPYATYSWQDATGTVISTVAMPDLGPGNYAVVVTDANGCSASANFGINETPGPNLSVSTADPTAFCNNSVTVTMQALTNADGNLTYQWFQNGTPVGVNAPTYSTNQYGGYTVQVTNPAGCTAVAGPVQIIQDCGGGGGGGLPGSGPDCPPGSATLQSLATIRCDSFLFAAGGPLYVPGSAQWVFGQSGAPVVGSGAGDNTQFVFPNAGQYVVALIVQLTNGSFCRLTGPLSVEAAAKFEISPECPGTATEFEDLSTFLPGSGITAWNWNFGDPASGAANTSAIRNATHIYANSGPYPVTLQITANSGCTASVTKIADIPAPTAPVIMAPAIACAGTTLAIGGNSLDIDWDFGDPASGSLNTASGQTVYHAFGAGNFTITATTTDIYGCTGSAAVNLNVAANTLGGTITPANPASLCEGNTLTLTAPAGGTNYLWSDSTTTSNTLVVGAEGVYSVTVSDANGCTFAPPPVSLNVNPGPDATIKALLTNELGQIIGVQYPTHAICAGEDVRLFVESPGGYTYVWSNGNTGVTIEYSDERGNLLGVGTHVFTVTITDPASGCTAVTTPFVVTVNPVPSGFSIANNIFPACAGSSNTLSYTGPNPGNWQYVWNTGQTDLPLVTTNPGVYFLRVINEFGCEVRSNPLTVLPGPNVLALPAGCHTRCKPDSLCLPPLPGITAWQWYFNGNPVPGATSPNFVAQQSGTYWAQLTDAVGCVNQSDPLTLNLLDGYGNILGQVWSDVNNNGLIDAGDTLVSGIPVNLLQGGATVGNAQSGAVGDFAFTNILSTNYTVEIDAGALPGAWQIVIGQSPASLTGCDVETQVGLLVKISCQTTGIGAVQLSACPGDSAMYNGTAIPAGSSQNFQLTDALGCDSVVTVTVSALPTSTSILLVRVCPGEAYNYNGTLIPAGTFQEFTLQNYLGCDSILTVYVSPLPTSKGAFNTSVCPGSSYDYNGTLIPAGSSQDFTLQNYLGCDSVLTVTVGTLPVSSGVLNASVCPGSSYDYNGTLIPAGSSQDFTLQNYLGCDSVLTVTVGTLPVSSGVLNASVCPGSSYDYNGTLIPAGSSQDFTLQNYLGCDSVLTVTVGTLPVSSGVLNASVCPGSSYDYNGTLIPAGSSQDFILQNYLGCDSVLTVTVGTLPVSSGVLNASVCPGSSYDYNGTLIPAGSSQDFVLQNYLGCDSILTVTVGTSPVSSGVLNASVCPGSSYDYNGTLIPAGSSQDFTLQNYLGCDSVLTVTVGTLPVSSGVLNASVCPGSSYDYNGTLIPAGSSQDFILQNYLGCDSILTVSVSALPTPGGSVQAAVCPGETFNYHGASLQIGETRIFTLQSGIGCDSLVTVTVSALPTSTETLNVTICPNEIYLYAGDTLQAGETRDFHFINAEGCDSTVMVTVSAFPEASFELSASPSCTGAKTGSISVQNPAGGQPPYRYSLDGLAFQDAQDFNNLQPGNYTVWLEDSNGCFFQQDTSIAARLPLTLELEDAYLPCDIGGVQLTPVVGGDPEGLSYQWSTGDQTPAILVFDPGPVWVEVRNVCETQRRDISVDWEGVGKDFSYLYVPNVFAPLSANPDNSRFRPYLAPELTVLNYKFEVFDRWGNLMFRTHDTSDGWAGPFRQKDMQPAVYVWYVLVDVAYCGRVRQIRKEGDVTIVR